MIRVMIVEEHDLVRQALESRLRATQVLDVVASVGDYTQAVQHAQKLRPDVILMETKVPQGLKTLNDLRCSAPWAAIIVLTSYPDSREEENVLQLGASAYVLKTLNTEALVEQIRYSAYPFSGNSPYPSFCFLQAKRR